MTDPLTTAAATTAVTAATAWLWTKFGDKIIELASSQTKAAWKHVNWKAASDRYRKRIIDLYGVTRIFGQAAPVALDDIYTDVYLLDRPTAFRRYDILQLRVDPDLLDRGERIPGRTLVTQEVAHRLYILGKPGAGKTTFLKHLALEAARGSIDKVPIFVMLKEWSDSGEDLLPFIVRQFAICSFPDAAPFLAHLLEKTGDALVLFDGLDEVQQEGGARSRAMDAVRNFSRQYDRAQCVITCRTATTDYTFEKFTCVEIADFAPEQVDAFVRKWYHHDRPKGEAFLNDIAREEHRGLREMARTPLLLAMLCLAFSDTLHFPSRRVEIYVDALDALLRKWDSSRNIRRDEIYHDLSIGRKHQLFARLAARSLEKGDYFLPQDDLERQIADYVCGLPRADRDGIAQVDGAAILRAIEAQHGILIERAHRIHSFAHLSFQEYYAARYIVDNAARGTLKSLLAHCADDGWREVILLTASLLDDADAFFLHFRRALDAIVGGDECLQAFLRWAVEKAAGVQAPLPASSLRAYYCCLAGLDRSPVTALNSDFGRDDDLDLNTGLSRARIRAGALVDALAGPLDRNLRIALTGVLDSDIDRALYLFRRNDIVARIADLSREVEHLERQRADLESEPKKLDLVDRGLADIDRILADIDRMDAELDSSFVTFDRVRGGLDLDLSARVLADFDFDLALDRVLYRTYIIVRERAVNLALNHAEVRELAERAGEDDLQHAISALSWPHPDSTAEVLHAFAASLRPIIITHRNLGHGWNLTKDSADALLRYYRATHLLVDCLDLAYASDRQAIEDTLLLPPGEWHLDPQAEKE